MKQAKVILNENGIVTRVEILEVTQNFCDTCIINNIYILTKKKEINNKYILFEEKYLQTFSKSKLKKPTLVNRKEITFEEENKEEIVKQSKPEPVKRKRTIPVYMLPYIEYWNEVGPRKHLDTSTKTFRKIIQRTKKLLSGTFYNDAALYKRYWNHPFTFLEFKRAVDRLKIANTDPLVLPRNKKVVRLGLLEFLINPFGKTIESGSYFVHFLENEPERIVPVDDSLTKELIRKYTLNVLGGIHARISVPDHQKFTSGSAKLRDFFNKNKANISPNFVVTNKRMANWLWDAIYKDVGDSMAISPGFFASEKTFTFRLPAYLKKQAILLGAPKKKSLAQLNRERRENS